MQMCAVQKWHTSSRKISLRRANCLAKINHMLAAGLHCWRRHTCTDHRSRWPFVVLYSAAGAASDLSSVYVAPGGIYAPSANVYVRPGPTHRPYAEPGYGYRQPSYVDPNTAHRQRSMASTDRPIAAQPVYVDRAPAYPERYYARQRYYGAGIRLRAGICAEAAAARALPRAGTMRRRLWQVGSSCD